MSHQNPTSSTALLTDLRCGAGPTRTSSSHAVATCPLFPTESEDYYCLSCYMQCSGLSLLVGLHTGHDYLPLKEALLYMPAALLRETQEVVRESEENFAKPWRVQDQQREKLLAYLLHQRQSKVAALEQLVKEIAHVDEQLLHATEAKALDLSNWRYQQRTLRRKMEKLARGADTLSAALGTSGSTGTTSSLSSTSSSPAALSWQRSEQVAQGELVQVRRLLARQLRQLEADEEAAHHQFETWHHLLCSVPRSCPGGEEEKNEDVKISEQEQHSSEEVHYSCEPTAPFTGTSAPNPPPLPLPAASTANVPRSHQIEHPSLHPSNAEVMLLQHALLNINDGLRHRLLRAAAASLSSSSASRSNASSRSPLPSSRRDGTQNSCAPFTPIDEPHTSTGETADSCLPPLPDETPLRDPKVDVPDAPFYRKEDEGNYKLASEPPSPALRQFTGVAASGTVGALAEDNNLRNKDDKQPHKAPWRSWQAQEKALKDSLNQLLRSGTTPLDSNNTKPHFSSSVSFVERSSGEYGAISEMSGPLSSMSVFQRGPLNY